MRITIILFSALLCLVSCNNKVIYEADSEYVAFTVKAHINKNVNSKATVNNGDGSSFMWQENDSFDMYLSTDQDKGFTFNIKNETISDNNKIADFVCNEFANPEGEAEYYAFYPSGKFANTQTAGEYEFSLPDAVYSQSTNNNTEHLRTGLAMVATGGFNDINSGITFKQKTSLFRFGITNNSESKVTIKSISLKFDGNSNFFAKKYVYKNSTETENERYETSSGTNSLSILLNGKSGILLNGTGGTDNILKVYTLAMSGVGFNTSDKFHVEAVLGNGTIIFSNEFSTGEITNWEAGKYYSFFLELNNDNLILKKITISGEQASISDWSGDPDLTLEDYSDSVNY